MNLKAVIVEDNKSELENLAWKLEKNCPQIDIIARCRSGEEAVQTIHQLRPDVLFLDIQLGTMTGFDVLDRLQHIHFEVIFTTGHNEYAIQAINALHNKPVYYLLKPIKQTELVTAVNKVWKLIGSAPAPVNRLAAPIQQQLHLLELDDIAYCESANNQTIFHFGNRREDMLIKKTLRHYEKELPPRQFFRIHRSYIVNRDYIAIYDRSSGGFVRMKSGKKLSISPDRREAFTAWLVQ